MLIKEFRVVMPFTLEEYHRAQLYMVTKKTQEENKKYQGEGRVEGLEVLINEPFDDGKWKGQYTLKHYHLGSQFPKWVTYLLPKNALIMIEHSWNAYPFCRTSWSCPLFEKMMYMCESMHYDDRGEKENALKVSDKILKQRIVDYIDLVNDPFPKGKYTKEMDPALFQSKKFPERGHYEKDWKETVNPVMCAYKLTSCDFKYWGVQNKAEGLMQKLGMRDLVQEAHRELICWMDDWIELTIDDIRRIEMEEAALSERLFQKAVIDPKQQEKLDKVRNENKTLDFGFAKISGADVADMLKKFWPEEDAGDKVKEVKDGGDGGDKTEESESENESEEKEGEKSKEEEDCDEKEAAVETTTSEE